MQHKKPFLMMLVFALLVGVGVTFASTDDQGNPNTPSTNDRANACYPGAVWEGKCDTTDLNGDGVVTEAEKAYMWTAGWYLIRYQYGIISRQTLNSFFSWLGIEVPVVVVQIAEVYKVPFQDTGCLPIWDGTAYAVFSGGLLVASPTYLNSACTTFGPNSHTLDAFVIAKDLADARSLCNSVSTYTDQAYRLSNWVPYFYACILP